MDVTNTSHVTEHNVITELNVFQFKGDLVIQTENMKFANLLERDETRQLITRWPTKAFR